jgi:membrane associated rhomboid family serine protease
VIKSNYAVLLTVITLTSVITVVFGYAPDALIYDGHNKMQLWRFITAHLSHYDSPHLLGNLTAFALLVYLFPASLRLQLKALILAVVMIDVYLAIANIQYYAGFSGLLYVIPGMVFFRFISEQKWRAALVIICLLGIYLFILSVDNFTSGNIQWQSLKVAHLLGFVAGFIVSLSSVPAIRDVCWIKVKYLY